MTLTEIKDRLSPMTASITLSPNKGSCTALVVSGEGFGMESFTATDVDIDKAADRALTLAEKDHERRRRALRPTH